MTGVTTLGVAGTGVIGAGWAARALFQGLDVVAYDPAEDRRAGLTGKIEAAWPAMEALAGSPCRRRGELRTTADLREMAQAAQWIQEAAPEREELKIELFAKLDQYAHPDVVLASSSSGFRPSRLQSACAHPGRLIVGHPFNPVYLLPLVETVPGKQTSPEIMERASTVYGAMGMKVLALKTEIDGYVCDRLQEALWREALHIINKDVATTSEIDDSIIYSAGLRWAFMGPFMTFHLGGGEGGVRHFLEQFDPALELPWTDLPFPPWSREMSNKLINGCEAQSRGRSIRELEEKRDAVLVDIMKVLAKHNIGAGTVLNATKRTAP